MIAESYNFFIIKSIILFILILSLFFQLTNCTQEKKEYATIVDYIGKTDRRDGPFVFSNDTLWIFFEENFNQDTVDLTFGQNKDKLVLTTNLNVGLSMIQKFASFGRINEFKISLNGRQEQLVKIKNRRMNKWAINFMNDTLYISVLNKNPFYD